MTYDDFDKVLFSADGFGKFGANDVEDPDGWANEARRYYIGIVGKYGAQVMSVLKKAEGSGTELFLIWPMMRGQHIKDLFILIIQRQDVSFKEVILHAAHKRAAYAAAVIIRIYEQKGYVILLPEGCQTHYLVAVLGYQHTVTSQHKNLL